MVACCMLEVSVLGPDGPHLRRKFTKSFAVGKTYTSISRPSQGDAANVIIRPDDIQKCAAVLKANKLELIAANDLYKL